MAFGSAWPNRIARSSSPFARAVAMCGASSASARVSSSRMALKPNWPSASTATGSTTCAQLSKPLTGSQSSRSANSMIRATPRKKEGNAIEPTASSSKLRAAARDGNERFRATAAKVSMREANVASSAISPVAERRQPSSRATERPVRIEMPRSPVTAPASQRPYCTISGALSPKRSAMAATSCCETAAVWSCRKTRVRITCAGSPGTRRSNT